MPTQLLQIESAFLNQNSVKNALLISEFRSLQRVELNAKKKRFDVSMEIGKLVTKGYEWFKTEGKTQLKENGIEWKTEDFFLKVYGWQKSYAYKLLRASALETQVVDNFKAECDRIDSEGKDAERSVAALLKYAKDGTIGGGEEGDEEGGEGSPSVVATFTYKSDDGNVSVRIMSDGSVKTTNGTEQVLQSLSNFREMLMGYAPNTEETLEQVMDVEECEA